MKTYFDYKNQIQGFGDVSETVKTVEKIAASSVHNLRQRVSNLNNYSYEIERMLSGLSLFYSAKNHFLMQEKKGKKAVVILTGEKGIVGSLWHNIINVFLENIHKYDYIIVVGSKGVTYLTEENVQIFKSLSISYDIGKEIEIENVINYIFNEFKKGIFSNVDILYPKFISLAEQQPNFAAFLPFRFLLETGVTTDGGMPIFNPSKKKIFNELLQKYIGVYFHKIIIETRLSELSARTVAAENATAKTDELIKKLTFDYEKERRRYITQKQLESFSVHKIV